MSTSKLKKSWVFSSSKVMNILTRLFCMSKRGTSQKKSKDKGFVMYCLSENIKKDTICRYQCSNCFSDGPRLYRLLGCKQHSSAFCNITPFYIGIAFIPVKMFSTKGIRLEFYHSNTRSEIENNHFFILLFITPSSQ